MALKVGELFASFNLDTSGIDGAVKSAESKMANMGKSLAIGGAAMTAAVTVPIKQAASAIYEAGSGFDAQMSKVFAIAGDSVTGSTEAMEALRQKALEMGSTTQFTASEAGEAMEYMAMAGWKTDQMLAAIGPLMNLAAAAGADLGTTSDIVTDAMTAFGYAATDTVTVVKDGVEMEVNAVEHFADVLAAASSNSNTNVTMLGESFKFAAPLAGALGYSVDDVAIALGLMANNGIKSSMAGTSLSRIIQNMAKPSKQTAEAMEALGVSLYNDRGEAKSLREIMGDFRGQAKKNGVDVAKLAADVADLDEQYSSGKITEEQYTAKLEELTAGSGDFLKNLTQLAGARGLPGLLAIMNATDEDFDKLCGAIDNATGSASEMKRVMLDNAKGDITLFKSALEGLEITLWGLAENGFRKVVQEATKYVDAFRNADKSTQVGVLKMGALAAAIGPAMAGMGGLIAILPKLARTFTLVSGPTALLAIGMLALGAAAIDSNNDIGKTFVKGITKAGIKIRKFGADIEKQLPTLTQNMSNFLNSLSTGIKSGLPGIIDGLTSIITTGVSAISANMPQIANVSQTLVTTLANSIKRNAPKIVPAVLDLLTNMATALISNIPVVLEGMGTVISSIITEVNSADWGEIGAKLKTAIEEAVKQAFTVFKKGAMGDKYVDDATWAQVGAAMIENIKDGIAQAVQNSKDLLGNLVLGEDYVPDDSWGTVAGKIWNKITTEMGTLLTSAGDLIKGLVLGDDYTPDASWDKVATKVWDSIKAAFATLAQNAKDLLGTIALGDDYTADTSWATIATKIWQKIQAKFTELKTNTKNLIGTLVMGSDYTADTSWGTISTKIWDKIKSKFTELKANTKDLIGTIVLGDDYTADTSWEKVGQAIWDKVKEKITSLTVDAKDLASAFGTIAGDIVTGIAGAIPTALNAAGDVFDAGLTLAGAIVDTIVAAFDSFNPDLNVGGIVQSLVDNITRAIGGVFDFGGKLVTAGAHIAGSLLDSLASSLDATINTTGVSEMTGKLKTFLQTLISKIVELVPKLFQTGGKVISAGMKLASELVKSLAEGFTAGEGLDIDLAGVAKGIVDGIVNAISNLPTLLDDVLSAGAQIANSIMTSIVDSLADAETSGIGTNLANAATQLIHGLLDSITNLGKNPDVTGFITKLGEGLKSAMYILGEFGADLVMNLFSAETLQKVFDAGKGLVKLILSGLGAALDGISGFLDGIVSSILNRLGIIDKDAMRNEVDIGNALNDAIIESITDSEGNLEHTAESVFATIMGAYASGSSDAFSNLIDGTELEQITAKLDQFFFDNSNMWSGYTGTVEEFQEAFKEAFSGAGIDIQPILDTLPDDFWQIAMDSVTGNANKGEGAPLMALLLQSMFGGGETADTSEAEAAIAEYYENTGVTAKETATQAAETVKQGNDTVVQAIQEGGNAFSQAGVETTLVNSEEPVAAAAAAVSDAAVQEFLLVMSEENGSAIATAFVGGIIAVFSDSSGVTTVATTLAQSARNAATSALRWLDGYNIGHNFGLGLLRGIESMINAVATAAANLGAAAAGALSGAIQEGSPSKLTAETGRNFGLGFINSILASVDEAGNAAALVGMSAASSLEQTISEISGDAADQMSIAGSGRRNEAEALAAENEKTAMTYASAIANALNGARVVMNGELVGELVTDTVSEGIASRYAGMRYGTV